MIRTLDRGRIAESSRLLLRVLLLGARFSSSQGLHALVSPLLGCQDRLLMFRRVEEPFTLLDDRTVYLFLALDEMVPCALESLVLGGRFGGDRVKSSGELGEQPGRPRRPWKGQ